MSSIFGGGGKSATREAGQVQTAASEEGQRISEQRFGETQANLTPNIQAGFPALAQFQALLGLGGTAGTAGGAGGFGGGQTADQIRQNLIGSGRFGAVSGPVSREEFEWQNKFGNAPPKTIDEAVQLWNQRGQEVETFVNPQELLKEGLAISGGAGGGIDEESLNAEIQRQLAQQGQAATGGQSALDAQQSAFESLVESPGQRFIRGRAEQGATRQAAALGGLGGGRVRTALTEQAAGFAQQDLQNRFARLQNLIGGGQQAATNLGSFGQQQAATAGGLLQQGAQARAGGILGAQQAEAQQGSNIAGLVGAGLSFFSDERLKEDIHDLDLEACYNTVMNMPLKAWKYLEETGLDQSVHMGVMAQDAPDCIRGDDVGGYMTLDLHDELTLIMGALQYAQIMNKVN